MGVARKLFRLFKFFNEYITIRNTWAKSDMADFDKYMTCLTRLAFAFYWLFDNMGVLIKVKWLQGYDLAATVRRANKAWLTGLILSIIHIIRKLVQNVKAGTALKKQKAQIGQEGGLDKSSYDEKVKAIKAARVTCIQNLVKNLGDCTTASQGLGYPKRFLGVEFSDGLVGVGGFTSAFLTCYQTYPRK